MNPFVAKLANAHAVLRTARDKIDRLRAIDRALRDCTDGTMADAVV